MKKYIQLNRRNKHIRVVLAVCVAVTIGLVGFFSYKGMLARAAIASDDKFTLVMPYYGSATQSTDSFLEIAQTGEGNTLDAPESWSKIYIDKGRVDDTTVGIFRGGYGPGVDSYGLLGSGSGDRFDDNDATLYEFFYGLNVPQTIPETGQVFQDERRCSEPFLTLKSGDLSTTGWSKISMSSYRNRVCGTNTWEPTNKSGKYVIFVRARWRQAPNPTAKGRVNAYKIGAAYANAKSALDTPLTGYWSNFSVATSGGKPGASGYSVQDRKSPIGDQGNYTFSFAPDCRLPIGKTETRYLHWKDVDFPEYYGRNYPPYIDQPDPEFDLIAIAPSGARKVVVKVNKDTRPYPFNGGSQNSLGSVKFTAEGGYKYEWVWKNITRVDGVSFWLPYDDYPYLAGCGSYEQKIGLWGSRGEGWTQSDFRATGGDTLQFMVDEQYTGGTGQAPDTTTNAYLASPNGSPYANTFADPGGATGISDNGGRVGRAQVQWTLPGMGPDKPYVNRRWLLFSYPIKGDAQNGAVHCFNATMKPGVSKDPLGILTSNTICVTIDNSLKPYITTSGADVHAGDCNYIKPGAQIGKITGLVNGLNQGSSGQYIVSSADAITNFGSGGSPNGGALTFGKGGFYGTMCRPLISALDPFKEKDVITKEGEAVSGPFDLGSLEPGKRYVVKFAADGQVRGTSRASVTVYAPNGTVTIVPSGNTFGSDTGRPYAKEKLPTVGITAKNIRISNGVAGVNATLYASGNITTCAENTVAACRSTLLLNGFMMARDFNLNRTGTGTNGLQLAEFIKFSPAFYLNPPPGQGVPAGMVQYLGERAPLY